MKFVVLACMLGLFSVTHAQERQEEEELKAYYLVILKKGPNRTQDSATAARIQKEHLDNINRLAQTGKLNVAGPFLDDGDMRGIFIFDSGNEQEVRSMVENDPAVKAGRLVYELHPWMTQKGICFK
jgi:uncharacterized protein YciI